MPYKKVKTLLLTNSLKKRGGQQRKRQFKYWISEALSVSARLVVTFLKGRCVPLPVESQKCSVNWGCCLFLLDIKLMTDILVSHSWFFLQSKSFLYSPTFPNWDRCTAGDVFDLIFKFWYGASVKMQTGLCSRPLASPCAQVPFWRCWFYCSLVAWARKCWWCASAVTVSDLVICTEDLARVYLGHSEGGDLVQHGRVYWKGTW